MNDEYMTAEPVPPPMGAQDKASGMAITALILAILGVPCCCLSPCCSSLLAIPGGIIGFLELNKIKTGASGAGGKWMALVAISLSIVSLIVMVAYLIFLFFFGGLSQYQQLLRRMG